MASDERGDGFGLICFGFLFVSVSYLVFLFRPDWFSLPMTIGIVTVGVVIGLVGLFKGC